MSSNPHELRELVESARRALFRLEGALENESDRAAVEQARAMVERAGTVGVGRLGRTSVISLRFPPTCKFALLSGELVPSKSKVRNVLRRMGRNLESLIEKEQAKKGYRGSPYLNALTQELASIEIALNELSPPSDIESSGSNTPLPTTEQPISEADLIANLNEFWGSETVS